MNKESKPLYSIIVDELRKQIESGAYKPDDQLPTEAELGARFGVSRITTRRALDELEREGFIYRVKGSGSYVKRQQPARGDIRPDGNGNVISLILPSESDRGTMGYIRGASEWLNNEGFYLSIHQSDFDSKKERVLLETLPKEGIAGIILYPRDDHSNYDVLYRLCLEGYPIVTIDKYVDSLPLGAVVSDNFAGTYKSVTRLIELGHRNIGFLSGVSIESTSSVRDRYFGYCKALKDHGLPIESRYVRLHMRPYRDEVGQEQFYAELLDSYRKNGITAVQTENDLIAANMLNRFLEAGKRIPEHFSISGFDNNPVTQHLFIPLTTVAQNFHEIGRKAAEIIVEWIRTGKPEPKKVFIPVQFMERGTTGPVPR